MDMPFIGIDALFNIFIWFSFGWFFVYVILGSWFKVKLVNLRMRGDLRTNKRLVPVFISHLLFSLLLVNPFTILVVISIGENISDSTIWGIVLLILYLGLLPIIWECFLLRYVSRLKGLRWLQWKPPLIRVVLVSLFLSIISYGGGYVTMYLLPDAVPTIVTTFHSFMSRTWYFPLYLKPWKSQ